MRVTSEHLDMLAAVRQYDTDAVRDNYRNGRFPRADKVKDLDKRYRWDLYYHCVAMGHDMPDSTMGYNDAHIDTALRSLVAPL